MKAVEWNAPETRPEVPGYYYRISGKATDCTYWDGTHWFHVSKSKKSGMRIFDTPHRQQDRAWREGTAKGADALPKEGERFGMLTYLHDVGPDKQNRRWLCVFRCDCGSEKAMNLYEVRSGRNRSCGCLRDSIECSLAQLVGRAKWLAAHSNEVADKNRELGVARQGSERGTGPVAKWALNIHAKEWCLISPGGEEIRGWNLSDLIRKNEHLFSAEDIEWKNGMCRASKGIRRMFENRNGRPHCNQWKGWRRGDVAQGPTKEAACQT